MGVLGVHSESGYKTMKEKTKREYIRISPSDFLWHPSGRSKESLFRSLEHYLVKNNQPHDLEGGDCIVYVEDKNDAMRIGNDIGLRFGLNKVEYFNGEELSMLAIVAPQMKRIMSRATVTDIASGEKVSFKKYKKETQKEIDQKYVSFKDISGKKIISPAKLEKLVTSGSLKEVNIGGKRYVNRAELLNFLTKR